jgi:menaquinone-dependent protoporphyrinogen oxidase
MPTRLLVAYATRAGSTGGVAHAIGEVLTHRGFAVDVSLIHPGLSPDGYGAVVIGSGVRTGSWLPEAVAFVINNQYALRRLPVALFTVHLNNTGDDAQSAANRLAYLDLVRPLLQPLEEVYFTGAVDPATLTVLERIMVRAVQAPAGDQRDWAKIQAWAEHLFV